MPARRRSPAPSTDVPPLVRNTVIALLMILVGLQVAWPSVIEYAAQRGLLGWFAINYVVFPFSSDQLSEWLVGVGANAYVAVGLATLFLSVTNLIRMIILILHVSVLIFTPMILAVGIAMIIQSKWPNKF